MKYKHRKYRKTNYVLLGFDERDFPYEITEGTKSHCLWSAKNRMKYDGKFWTSYKRVAIAKCRWEEMVGWDSTQKGWVKS